MKKFVYPVLMALAIASINAAWSDSASRAAKILTPELAQKLLGTPVKANGTEMPDTEMGKTWVSHVSYKATNPAAGGITLLIRHAASPDEAKTVFEQSKATFKGVTVAGLGDAAYRTERPAQLAVLKGSNWMIISVGTFKTPDTAGQEKVAKELLPKITGD